MRLCLLILILMTGFSYTPIMAQTNLHDKNGVLVREIQIQGFLLGDAGQFTKLFKAYRNKYMTTDDMDALLHKIQVMYEREGYQELVTISYTIIKHRLVFSVLMTS